MGDNQPGIFSLATDATNFIKKAADTAKNILPGSTAAPTTPTTPATPAGGKSRRYRKAKASSKKAKRAGSTRRRHHKRK